MTYIVTKYNENGEIIWQTIEFKSIKDALFDADMALEMCTMKEKVTVTDENGALIAESKKNKWWQDLVLTTNERVVRYNQYSWNKEVLILDDDGYWKEYKEEQL